MVRAIVFLLVLALPALSPTQGMPFGGTSRLMIAIKLESKKELKITKDQDKKIQERVKKVGEDMQKGIMPKGFSFTDGLDIDLDDILDEGQRARLEELFVQSNGGFALADPKVAAKLNLTEDQLAKVKEIKSECAQVGMQAMQTARSAQAMKEIMKKRDEYALKAEAVLTAEQKPVFESLKGKPFKFKT